MTRRMGQASALLAAALTVFGVRSLRAEKDAAPAAPPAPPPTPVLSLAPGPATQITAYPSRDIQPTWSPDGRTIYFVTDRFRGMSICSVSALGGPVRMVTAATGLDGDLTPDVNAEGLILFSSTRARGVQQIFTCPQDSATLLTQLTTLPKGATLPSWSPDGKQVAFASPDTQGKYSVCVMDRDGGNIRLITPGFQPRWSPDGHRLVFVNETPGPRRNWDVYTIGLDGKGLTQHTRDDTNEFDPDWSPDGNWICCVSVRDRILLPRNPYAATRELQKKPHWEIWAKNIATNQPSVRLAGSENRRDRCMNPRWSPDGRQLAFCSDRNGNMDIWRMWVAAGTPQTP